LRPWFRACPAPRAATANQHGRRLDAQLLTELCALDRYERQVGALRNTARRRLDQLNGNF
jgi:hypothetical protein